MSDESGADAGPPVYRLGARDMSVLVARARQRVAALGGKEPNHLLGVLGEACVLDFLRRQLPELNVFDVSASSSSPADIQVVDPAGEGVMDLEVKTVSKEKWQTNGREIGRDQWNSTTAAAYVWCRADSASATSGELEIVGWLPRSEMRLYSIPPPVPPSAMRWIDANGEWDDDGSDVPLVELPSGMDTRVLNAMKSADGLPDWIRQELTHQKF